MELTLSSPCSRSYPPLSYHGAALAYLQSLPPHNLMIWINDSIPFPFGKKVSGVLANCSLCAAEAILSFSAGPAYSSFSAEVCAILHALLWSRQHQRVCHFSLRFLLCPWHIWQKLASFSSFTLRLQWVFGHSFFRGTTQLMSWPGQVRYSYLL